MELCGFILKAERLKQNFSIEDMSRKTKIRRKYIESIEENDFNAFPATVYIYGFVSLYASGLGLRSRQIVDICKKNMSLEKEAPYKLLAKKTSSLSWKYLIYPVCGAFVALLYFTIRYNLA